MNFVIFHPRQRKLPFHVTLSLNDIYSNQEYSIKHLGIIIYSNLSWKSQVSYIAEKIKTLWALNSYEPYLFKFPRTPPPKSRQLELPIQQIKRRKIKKVKTFDTPLRACLRLSGNKRRALKAAICIFTFSMHWPFLGPSLLLF